MIKKILFLQAFLSCPQKKTPLLVRLVLFAIQKIQSVEDVDILESIKKERILLIKPSELADFYNHDQEIVRANLAKSFQQLLDLKLVENGCARPCFEKVDVVRFKGYLLHISESFLALINECKEQSVEIDVYRFGKLDSVYSQTLYAQLVDSIDNATILSIEYIRSVFVLEGLYNNNSYNLSKKCVGDPLKKINKVFDTQYDFEKVKVGNDVLWLIAEKNKIPLMKAEFC